MLWRRYAIYAVLAVLACAALIWPLAMVWTFTLGGKATATVTDCHLSPRTKRGAEVKHCEGTWRTEDGATGRGSLYGLDTDTPDGTRVPVRFGPLGPYAGGLADQYRSFTPAAVLGIIGLLCALRPVRRAASGRATARALLDSPPGATKLIVTRTEAKIPGGGRYVSFGPAEAPPGYRPPRPTPRQLSGVSLHWPLKFLGTVVDPKGFAALHDPSGRPLLFLHYDFLRRIEPDYVLVDTSGKPHLTLRRLRWNPSAYALLDPEGMRIGSAGPVEGRGLGVLEVKDASGALAATAACRGRSWVLRAEPSASPLLRDASLVATFLQHRLGD